MNKKLPIGILGATGMVGQRYIQLLENHPMFEIAWLAASDRSSGKKYGEAAKWRLDTTLPKRIAEMTLSAAEPTGAPKVIFSSVDSPIAKELEPLFASKGHAVISNSSAFRMAPNVPLVLPEVNSAHLSLIESQESYKQSGGFIVTNSNCTVMGPVLSLKPLADRFGLEQIFTVSMQAVSGAGYPGVPSMDVLDNIVPYIPSEEEKMEEELFKLLGQLEGGSVTPLAARMSANCNRVPVVDGHTVCISIKLREKATKEQILQAWADFKPLAGKNLPFAPEQPVVWCDLPDRPQPRLDRNRGGGMSVTTGRLRPCNLLDWKYVVLSHNTVRGAAGATILNAEMLASMGKLD